MKTLCLLTVLAAAPVCFGQSFTESFDLNPVLGSADPGGNAASGQWYVDRSAPALFASTNFLGDNRLVVGVNGSDYLSDSGSQFYDTQGRKYYLNNAPIGTSLSAQLYIPSSWQSINLSASMWLTAYDSSGNPAGYPIVGFYSSGTGDNYMRVWDDVSGYINLSTPVHWDGWNTLAMTFTGSGLVYTINGQDVFKDTAVTDNGGVSIANVMFQDRNYGTSFNAYWDNLTVNTNGLSPSPTPEPASLALAGMGAALLGLKLYRRRS